MSVFGKIDNNHANVYGRFRDGFRTEARFAGGGQLEFDLEGNLLVADTGNHFIRKITHQGQVTKVAGGYGGPQIPVLVGGFFRGFS